MGASVIKTFEAELGEETEEVGRGDGITNSEQPLFPKHTKRQSIKDRSGKLRFSSNSPMNAGLEISRL